jgi:hypothetical protein
LFLVEDDCRLANERHGCTDWPRVEEDQVRIDRDFRIRGIAHGNSASRSRVAAILGAVNICWAFAAPASAALGEAYVSVEADRARLTARLSSTTAATHAVQTLTLANGGVAREYTRGDGIVFAVSWRGPGRPDLRQLLGGYFDQFQSDNALRAGRRARRPLAVNRADFIVQSGGHPGAFWGVAYLPRMAPAGFSLSDLK